MKVFHQKLCASLLIGCCSLLSFSGLVAASSAKTHEKSPKLVLGWLESTRIMPWNTRVKTKLDPGAKTSSMQAQNIERFQKNGNAWVGFTFTAMNLDTKKEESYRIERPVSRDVVIKRHGGKNSVRPVVEMNFCLYHQIYNAEFTLADRGKFNYPVLLGRSFLSKVAYVDSGVSFLSSPQCEGNTFIQDASE